MNDPDWQTSFVAAISEALRPEVEGWVDEGQAIRLLSRGIRRLVSIEILTLMRRSRAPDIAAR